MGVESRCRSLLLGCWTLGFVPHTRDGAEGVQQQPAGAPVVISLMYLFCFVAVYNMQACATTDPAPT